MQFYLKKYLEFERTFLMTINKWYNSNVKWKMISPRGSKVTDHGHICSTAYTHATKQNKNLATLGKNNQLIRRGRELSDNSG